MRTNAKCVPTGTPQAKTINTICASDFFKARDALQNAKVPTPSMCEVFVTSSVTNCFNTPNYPSQNYNYNKKEETTMAMEMESNQRQYLEQRIRSVASEKSSELRRAFGLDDDKSPQSTEEFIARIKAGEFVLRGETDEYGYLELGRIRWRKPDAVKDQDSYNAAEKRVEAAQVSLTDKARLYPIADATSAFEDFKAQDFKS